MENKKIFIRPMSSINFWLIVNKIFKILVAKLFVKFFLPFEIWTNISKT